jgi:hypothetical protein
LSKLSSKEDGVNATEKRNMIICVTNLSELAHRDKGKWWFELGAAIISKQKGRAGDL